MTLYLLKRNVVSKFVSLMKYYVVMKRNFIGLVTFIRVIKSISAVTSLLFRQVMEDCVTTHRNIRCFSFVLLVASAIASFFGILNLVSWIIDSTNCDAHNYAICPNVLSFPFSEIQASL